MNYTEIIEKTYALVDTIKTSNPYLLYIEYEKKVLDDNELKKLLSVFQENKVAFEEVYKYKSYYPNFDEIKKQYQQSKIDLMNHELFKTYKRYEKEIDLYINEIEFKLKRIVNIKEKHEKINMNFKVGGV
ncbi:YlbF family regulator [Mycoplasmatota bacterium]|nr:YlbF family regulator [Mycoplasmatota bacterium]